jgi:hypothetical protein
MRTNMSNLTGAALVAAAALVMGQTQNATQELRISDIRAQQPPETIYASALCQRAKEAPRGRIVQPYAVDPKSFVQDLNSLMERSDEVILAGSLDSATVLSPSGESTATYHTVKVIRSWKGLHHAGDALTFGVPIGSISCERSSPSSSRPSFEVTPDGFGVPVSGSYVWILFLRKSASNEARLVQGLLPAAGEGIQGMFLVGTPPPTNSEPEQPCAGPHWSVEHCNSYLETSQSPAYAPYAHDPLAKQFNGMPLSDFLLEVQSVAAGQRLAQKPSLK